MSEPSTPAPTTLLVEIAADSEPVCGRIGRAGDDELVPFTGWTELAVAIEYYMHPSMPGGNLT